MEDTHEAEDHFDYAANGTDHRLLSRRRALQGAGMAGLGLVINSTGVLGFASSPAWAATVSEIPDETAGPYPGDGSNGPNVLTQDGIVRSDIRSSFGEYSGTATGVTTTVNLTIINVNDQTPYVGAAVYLWHCTQGGGYSLYTVSDQNYLRGVQVTDENGQVSFTTVFPGCYDGRWPHMHFEVYPDVSSITSASNALKTSQWALPEAACTDVYNSVSGYETSVTNLARTSLATDGIFRDGYSLELLSATGSSTTGYTLTGVAGIDAPIQSTDEESTPSSASELENFVDQLYEDFLHRSADASGRASWVARLQDGSGTRSTIAVALAYSTEGLGLAVDSYYEAFMDRSPDAAGRSYWVSRLQTGLTPADLVASLLASDEIYAKAGGTTEGFVNRVYTEILGRSPDTAGSAYWVTRIETGTSRASLVTSLYQSLESRQKRVTAAYQDLLGRSPDTSGRDFWAGVILIAGDIALRRYLAASDEYFNLAQS